MFHILAEVAPLKVVDGSRPVLRASSAQDRRLNGVAGQRWWPAISKSPSLAIPLFDGDFTDEVAPGSASFTIRLNALEQLDAGVRGYRWAGAIVSLYAIDPATALNAAGSYDVADLNTKRIFKGRVEGFSVDGGALALTAEVDQEPFNKDVLRFTYAGTGDAEGGADLKGRLKPWIFGRALNVEPILINSVDNVVQFSAYAIQGISALYERGSSLGASVGNYATYAELVAATIPPGRWATCHALGMARLGAPPYGVITGDVDGDNAGGFIRRTGAIIKRVALDAGVSADLIDTASLDALDAAVPYNVNLVLTEQLTVIELARRLALPCNAQAGINFLGRLFTVRPTIGAPTLTLDAQGKRLPPVRKCQEADVSAPYKRIMFGANRSWRVHTFDEIAFDAELIDRGDYDATKTYRRGNIVSLPNGSRWLFVSNTPKAGSLPAEGNADWELMTGAITAGNITYEDGTPVETLKPAEPGATDGMNETDREEVDLLAAATAAAQAAIVAAQAEIAAIEGSVTADFSAINAEVDALQGSLSAAQTNIGSLQATNSALTSSVGTLQGQMSAAQNSISAIQGSVGTLTANVSDLQSYAQNNVASLNSSVGTLNTNVSALQTQANTISTSVSGLADKVAAQGGQISTINTTLSTQGASISTLQTTVSNTAGNLATLTTRVNASQTNILPNGGLENGLTGALTVAGYTWNNSPEWGPNATTITNGTQVFTFADITSVQVGATYWIHCDPIAYGTSTVYCDLLFLDSGGALLLDGPQNQQTGQFNFSPDDIKRGQIAVSAVAPANTARIRVRIVAEVKNGAVAGFRRVKVETGPRWTPFSQEASVVSTWAVVNTTTQSLASLSTTVSTQGGSISTLQSSVTTLQGSVSTLQSTVSTQGSSITTLQTSMSSAQGDIATLKTQVTAGGGNLLTNTDLAVDTAGWTFSTSNGSVGGRNNPDANWYPSTENTLAIQQANGTTTNTAEWTQYIELVGGKWYDVSVYAASVRAGVQIYLQCIDASGAVLTTPTSGFIAAAGGGKTLADFPIRSFKSQVPAATVRGRLYLRKWGTLSGNTDSWAWFLRPQVAEVLAATASPLSYSPGNARASIVTQATAVSTLSGTVSTLSTTVSTQGGSISTLQSSMTTAQGNISTLQTTVSSQGGQISTLQSTTSTLTTNVSNLQSTVSTQGAAITANATAITTLQGSVATLSSTISASSSPNLLKNGGFENGLTNWTVTGTGWYASSGGWGQTAITYDNLANNGYHILASDAVAADPGAQFTVTADNLMIFSGSAVSRIEMVWYDSSNAEIGHDYGPNKTTTADFSATGGNRQALQFTRTAPANTAKVRVFLVTNKASGTLTVVGWRQAKLEKGAIATAYTGEASVAQQWTAYADLNTSYATLSTTVASQGGSISTLQSSMTNAQGSISSLQTTVATQGGSISTLQSSMTTAQGNISTLQTTVSSQGASISTLQSTTSTLAGNVATLTTRVSASQANLLPNGGLENGFVGANSVAAFGWSNSAEWGAIATTSTNGTQVFQFADILNVQIGATYWIHCDPVAYGASIVYCDILFLDSSGATLLDGPQNPQTGQFNFSPDDVKRGQIAISAVAPANTARIRARVIAIVSGGSVAGFRRVKVETGPRWTSFSQEAAITSTWTAVNTATTSLATLTTRVGTAEGSITTLQSSMTSANGSISTLQTNVSSLQGSVSTLQSSSTTQAGQISTLQTTVSSQGASITAQGTAITTLQGSVSTLSNIVAASSNPNIISGFENGLLSWFGGAFTISSGAWGATAYRNANFSGLLFLDSPAVSVFPGATYTAAADSSLFTTGTGSTRVEILFKNAAGSVVGNPQSASRYSSPNLDFTNDGSSRAILKASGVAPSDAVTAQVRLTASMTSGNLTSLAWRQPKLEQGAIATPYSGEASAAQTFQAYADLNSSYATLSTTVSSQSGSISMLQSSYTALNGTVSSLQSTVSSQGGQISTLQTTTSTLQGTMSNLTTRVSASQNNLAINGGLENGYNSGVISAGNYVWNISAEWGPTASTTVNGTQVFTFADITNVQAGATYWVHCDALAYGTSSIYCDLLFYNAAGTLLLDGGQNQQVGAFNFSANDSRRALIAASAVAPTGTARIRPRIVAEVVGNQIVGFRRFKVETGPTWSSFSTEASAVQQATAISTATSQISTLSTTVSTQGGSISTLQSSMTTAQGNISTLQSTVSSQGASISSLQTTTSTLAGNVATLNTQVTAGSNPNLLKNGGFENGLTNWTAVGAGWGASVGGWGSTAATYTQPSNGAYIYLISDVFGIDPGATYTVTADNVMFKSGDCVSRIEILWYGSDGSTEVGHSYGNNKTAQRDFDSAGVNRAELKLTQVAPSNANYARVSVVSTKNSGTMTVVGWRQAKFERGATATPYSAEASITQSFSALSTLSTQYASLSSTVSAQGASITQNATAVSGLNGQFASLSSTVSSLSSSVSTQQSAITDLQGRTSAYWQVTAVAGGRAQLTVFADANGGGGVDILGDLRVTGNALISGTVNPEALALSRFVRRVGGSGAGSPNAGQNQLLASMDLGTVTANGSYALSISGTFQTNVGRTTGTFNSKPLYTNNTPDGGLLVQIVRADGTVIASYTVNGAQYAGETPNMRTINAGGDLIFDAPANDDVPGGRTLRIYAIRGNADTGNIANGDYYQRDISATYSNFSITAKLKWTFI